MKITNGQEPFESKDDIPVRMVRERLDGMPAFDFPEGYTLRWYAPGDEAHWMRIHHECMGYGDLKPTLFTDQYGSDPEVLSQRIAFVCRKDGHPVSTNTAWMSDWNGQNWGRVHWVATCVEEQGKGLSKPLMTAVCERLRDLGHERAYLTTNTARVRAIALYAGFGFKAYWESEKEREAWEKVIAGMKRIGKMVEKI